MFEIRPRRKSICEKGCVFRGCYCLSLVLTHFLLGAWPEEGTGG